MTAEPTTVSSLLGRWRSFGQCADDLSAVIREEMPRGTVRTWNSRESIPALYHRSLILAAARRGFVITADELIDAHDAYREPAA